MVKKWIVDYNEDILNSCSTKPGSSGSPIINIENYKVFGIHKGYIKSINLNIGTLIKNHINKFYKRIKDRDKIKGDEIKMKYKIDKDKKIRIFGDLFVENNKDKFKIIYKGKEEEIKSYIEIENINNNELFVIKFEWNEKYFWYKRFILWMYFILNIEVLEYFDSKNRANIYGLFYKCSSLSFLPDIS